MRCNSVNLSPTAIKLPVSSSPSYNLQRFCQAIATKKHLATLLLLLGIGGGVWITHEVIAPQITQAETARVSITLDREVDEDYETLLSRAEDTARAAVQRSFDQDRLVNDVAITILAENQGAIAPVLSIQVSRPQWNRRSDTQRWVTYYRSAEFLLHFREVAVAVPVAVPTMTPGPGQGNFRRSH